MKQIESMMTGNVYKVLVREGDTVESEQEVVILESMKMEIPITADFRGIVKAVKVSEGDFVNEGDLLLELD